MDLIVARPEGLYCPPGDFYIDPWRPVARAVITHAHSDHARVGHGHYLAHTDSAGTLRTRLGEITLQTVPYGEVVEHNGVRISLFPAGHVLGSAQVRVEHGGEVWVASGDYKLEDDGTCPPFEPVRCHTFITESTFGLPIYRWPAQPVLFADIDAWWRANAAAGRASVLFCYAFGKAQRILHGVDAGIGPVVVHGAVEPLNAVYRAAGVALPPTLRVTDPGVDAALLKTALVLAPPSAQGTPWMRRFGNYADAFASGWMQLRGTRRRRGVDRGFVMSDHADWPGLQQAIAGTGAERVFVTHGSVAVLVRWLTENGLEARGFKTEYGDEDDERQAPGAAPAADAAPPVAAVGGDASPLEQEAPPDGAAATDIGEVDGLAGGPARP
jgi:putative mRNA 3-end processing factor